MSRTAVSTVAVVLALLGATPAAACPVCSSETGERVRAGVFGAEFGANALLIALPFAVLFGVVALLHFGPPRLRPRPPQPGAKE